jgi:lysophospholipase L1-like esterase
MLVACGWVVPAVHAAGGDKTAPAVSYVALGDSIATGKVTYWSSITSYVTSFHRYLQACYGRKTTVTLANLARDGDTSSELRARVEGDEAVRTALQGADIITICIGGNNLMQAARVPGFTVIDWDAAEAGTQAFEADWGPLMTSVNGMKKPGARVIVMNLYNPYNLQPSLAYSSDRGLHERVQPYVQRINSVIQAGAGVYGYRLADVNTAFSSFQPSSMGAVTFFYPDPLTYLLRNPHPNANGQAVIADLHRQVFKAFQDGQR